jgi:hypothetical protein
VWATPNILKLLFIEEGQRFGQGKKEKTKAQSASHNLSWKEKKI